VNEPEFKGVIEGWRCIPANDDPFMAPELAGICIAGRFGDKHIRTSRVKHVEGRMVTTASGNGYELGEVDPDYLDWIKSEGRSFDPANPIKVVR
jgi:hypothetical protein